MAKIIYRTLIILGTYIGIFFLGSIVGVTNPTRYLMITIGIIVVLTIGYFLGKATSLYGDEDNNE